MVCMENKRKYTRTKPYPPHMLPDPNSTGSKNPGWSITASNRRKIEGLLDELNEGRTGYEPRWTASALVNKIIEEYTHLSKHIA